jgi:hypothetical protein
MKFFISYSIWCQVPWEVLHYLLNYHCDFEYTSLPIL